MKVVGIDPGLKGAIAFVEYEKCIIDTSLPPIRSFPLVLNSCSVIDLPTTIFVDDREIPDAVHIFELIEDFNPDFVILEHVEARPGRGATSAWRFASGFGATKTACMLAAPGRVHFVRPRIWKSAMRLSDDKIESIVSARSAFPELSDSLTRKMDDGRAEALLLCKYFADHLSAETEIQVM